MKKDEFRKATDKLYAEACNKLLTVENEFLAYLSPDRIVPRADDMMVRTEYQQILNTENRDMFHNLNIAVHRIIEATMNAGEENISDHAYNNILSQVNSFYNAINRHANNLLSQYHADNAQSYPDAPSLLKEGGTSVDDRVKLTCNITEAESLILRIPSKKKIAESKALEAKVVYVLEQQNTNIDDEYEPELEAALQFFMEESVNHNIVAASNITIARHNAIYGVSRLNTTTNYGYEQDLALALQLSAQENLNTEEGLIVDLNHLDNALFSGLDDFTLYFE